MKSGPDTRRSRAGFQWRTFAYALVASLLLHGGVVVPRLLGPLAELLRHRPVEEVEVSFLPDPDAPALEDPAPEAPAPEQKRAEAKLEPKPEPKQEKPPEPAVLPEPPPPPPPVVAQAPPPPPPPAIDKRKQMVSQDRFEEEEDNKDAKYLAEKNHRVQEETRTESTNLVREAEGQNEKSAPNDNQDPKPGEREQKIAQLERHTGTDLPRSSPQQGHEGQSQDPRPQKPGPLAMRNLMPRASERPEVQQRDGVERQELAQGELPMQRKGQDGERGGATKKGGVKLQLDHHNYDNIEGFSTAEKERREAARAERSHVRGRYDRYLDKLAALKSSLENFTPDVKIGNQAELGTRASPFAAYITAMHRQIHSIYTFGFLADQDRRVGKTQFDDETLWTQLQITLKGDGTVEKVGVIRASGNVAFDAVAIDSVMSAAPFPKPPAVIRSANGKVYMDWQFHRDERACGTFGVDPHILTTPGEDVAHDTSETGGSGPRPRAGAPGAMAAAGPRAGGGGEESEGPRRLQRAPRAAQPASEPAAPAVVPEVTAEVRTAAEGWFAAWARGDVSWLTGWSAVPFLANGQVSARTPDALRSMYKQMIAEQGDRKVGAVEVLTPGGLRARIGGLPPGGQESEMLFAVGQAGGESFTLLLRKSDHGWRVAGLTR